MEKKDLMIGDWVLLTDGPARVISIAQDGIYFEDKFGEGICNFHTAIDLVYGHECCEHFIARKEDDK